MEDRIAKVSDLSDLVENHLIFDLHQKFGTSTRALYTTFEITSSGGWPTFVWRLVNEVSWFYAIYFWIYVYIVVFAVIRIIAALFLKETLSVAAEDADTVIQERMRETKNYAAKLEKLCKVVDLAHDGNITATEFMTVMQQPEAKAYLSSLEVSCTDIASLFHLLDDGTGSVSYSEFISGIVRLKGQARSQDLLLVLHELKALKQDFQAARLRLKPIDSNESPHTLII